MDLPHAPSDGKWYDQNPINDAAAYLVIFVLRSWKFHHNKTWNAIRTLVNVIDNKGIISVPYYLQKSKEKERNVSDIDSNDDEQLLGFVLLKIMSNAARQGFARLPKRFYCRNWKYPCV